MGTRLRPGTDGHAFSLEIRQRKKKEWFEGEEAERLIGQIIPKMNRRGGKKEAVRMLYRGSSTAVTPATSSPTWFRRPLQRQEGHSGIRKQDARPHEARPGDGLHEEQERGALEGELWRLERAWEEAEAIAAIADSLLLPTGTGDFIEKHREALRRRQ